MASTKKFADLKKPVRQPTPEQIAAFEETGRAAPSAKAETQKPANAETRKAVDTEARIHDDAEILISANTEARISAPLVRLTINLPESAHTRFKTACARSKRKMIDEVRTFIEQRTIELEGKAGYVAVEVVASPRSRMCIGLVVRLLGPLFAAHHRQRWPGSLGNSGATPESLNQKYNHYYSPEGYRMSVERWAMRCMDGVFRSSMKTNPLAGLPPVLPA